MSNDITMADNVAFTLMLNLDSNTSCNADQHIATRTQHIAYKYMHQSLCVQSLDQIPFASIIALSNGCSSSVWQVDARISAMPSIRFHERAVMLNDGCATRGSPDGRNGIL